MLEHERIAQDILALIDAEGPCTFAKIAARVPGALGSHGQLGMPTMRTVMWHASSLAFGMAMEILRPITQVDLSSIGQYALDGRAGGLANHGLPASLPISEVEPLGTTFPRWTFVPLALRRRRADDPPYDGPANGAEQLARRNELYERVLAVQNTAPPGAGPLTHHVRINHDIACPGATAGPGPHALHVCICEPEMRLVEGPGPIMQDITPEEGDPAQEVLVAAFEEFGIEVVQQAIGDALQGRFAGRPLTPALKREVKAAVRDVIFALPAKLRSREMVH